jgi:excisionase family DNA binding protein
MSEDPQSWNRPQTAPLGEALLSLEETAARLGISRRKLRELADAGQVPCLRIPDGRGFVRRFRLELVERALIKLTEDADRTRPREEDPR